MQGQGENAPSARLSHVEIEWKLSGMHGCTEWRWCCGRFGPGSAHHLHLTGRSEQAVMVAEEPADASGDASAGSVR
eukprot:COSAG06_NODE_45124_length_357_cov_0.996124_1_plen_75_part_10